MENEYAETSMVAAICFGIEDKWKRADTPRDYCKLAYTLHGAALAALFVKNDEAYEDFRFLSDLATHMEIFQ